MKTMKRRNTLLTPSSSKDAAETAIDLGKGAGSGTWEAAAKKGGSNRISRWVEQRASEERNPQNKR